jgi:hypothetical protein
MALVPELLVAHWMQLALLGLAFGYEEQEFLSGPLVVDPSHHETIAGDLLIERIALVAHGHFRRRKLRQAGQASAVCPFPPATTMARMLG